MQALARCFGRVSRKQSSCLKRWPALFVSELEPDDTACGVDDFAGCSLTAAWQIKQLTRRNCSTARDPVRSSRRQTKQACGISLRFGSPSKRCPQARRYEKSSMTAICSWSLKIARPCGLEDFFDALWLRSDRLDDGVPENGEQRPRGQCQGACARGRKTNTDGCACGKDGISSGWLGLPSASAMLSFGRFRSGS